MPPKDDDLEWLVAAELKTFHKSEKKTAAEYVFHRVAPGDSIMGLSIKYGISAEQLRRANKLWAQDNIFSRKVLFIPRKHCSADALKSLGVDNVAAEEEPAGNSNGVQEGDHAPVSASSFLESIDSRMQQAKDGLQGIARSKSLGSSTNSAVCELRLRSKTTGTVVRPRAGGAVADVDHILEL